MAGGRRGLSLCLYASFPNLPWLLLHIFAALIFVRRLVQSDEPRYNTPFREALAKGKAANIKPYFKNNKANQGVMFNEDMTYFKNIGDPQKLDAVKNYGMKTYEQIKRDAAMYAPETPPAQTKEEFLEWWKQEAEKQGSKNDDLIFKDPKGNDILLTGNPTLKPNKGTYVHIINNNHFDYGYLAKETITQPNETWSKIKGGKLEHYYLKYYKEGVQATPTVSVLPSHVSAFQK